MRRRFPNSVTNSLVLQSEVDDVRGFRPKLQEAWAAITHWSDAGRSARILTWWVHRSREDTILGCVFVVPMSDSAQSPEDIFLYIMLASH